MTVAALHWIRRNLFANPADAVLTLLVLPLCAWIVVGCLGWAFGAARWDVIAGSLQVLMTGTYPSAEIWRAWLVAALLAALCGGTIGAVLPFSLPVCAGIALLAALGAAALRSSAANGIWTAFGVTAFLAGWITMSRVARLRSWLVPGWLVGMAGVFAIYARPGLDSWGGLILSVILTITTSILTLPLGILLAFGRRSRIASLRVCSAAYIETMRAMPLILVVYWIWIVMPLLAPDVSVPGLVRAMLGYALFFSAYVAEFVRSGLQAVPHGQVEAARSLGMGPWTVSLEIVLPQALRVVVPALVGNVLAIFNAATLVFIIGLTDFLRAGQMILANPQYSGRSYETYLFMFAVYFAIGSTVTFASRRLEAHLGRAAR